MLLAVAPDLFVATTARARRADGFRSFMGKFHIPGNSFRHNKHPPQRRRERRGNAERKRDREIERQRDREIERQRDREIER